MIHEITHVILRRETRNINDSTPEFVKMTQERNNDEEFNEEIGIMAETSLFGGKIDFLTTIQTQTKTGSFKSKLFVDMLNKIMNLEQRVDVNSSIVYVPRDLYSRMAIDMVKCNHILEG